MAILKSLEMGPSRGAWFICRKNAVNGNAPREPAKSEPDYTLLNLGSQRWANCFLFLRKPRQAAPCRTCMTQCSAARTRGSFHLLVWSAVQASTIKLYEA